MIEVIEYLIGAGVAPTTIALGGLVFVYRKIGGVETRLSDKLDNGLSGSLREVRETVAELVGTCKARGENCD